MKLFVIGAGSPIPSFIARRLNALAEAELKIVVSLEYRQKCDLHPAINIIRYGNVWSMRFMDLFAYLGYLLTKPRTFFRVWKLNKAGSFNIRIKTTLKYFPLAVVPDVSIIHFQWLTLISGVSWLKEIYRVPVMASVRGSQVTVYPFTRPGFSETVRQSIKLVDVLHLVSKDLEQPCINFGARPDQMVVNYNGIDLTQFSPVQPKELATELRLISTGAVMWRKGYLLQLEIVRKLMPFVNVSLTIIGSGPDLDGLRYMAIKLGIVNAVIFKGRASESQVLSLLREADVYISTSAAEGLSNSCMEAAACGLPIVSFDCEGVKELVEPGITGYILSYGDVDGFVDAIRQLIEPQHRLQMGQLARKKMEAEFDKRSWVDKMIETYQYLAQSVTHE